MWVSGEHGLLGADTVVNSRNKTLAMSAVKTYSGIAQGVSTLPR